MQDIRFPSAPWVRIYFSRILSGVFCGVLIISWGHTETSPPSDLQKPPNSLATQNPVQPFDQDGDSSERPAWSSKKLEEIVVVATRTAQEKNKVPASISTYSAQDIINGNISSPQELIRHEVGVSTTRSAGGGGRTSRTSTGVQDYNIRGLAGNRVLLIEDGIRAPDIFSFQGNIANGRAFYDFDSLKSVELVKSSASALYGGGALGGVVSYTTKDPSDFLTQTKRPYYFGYKQSFDSADLSWGETATFAARTGPVEYLLLYTRRDGREQNISASTSKYGPAKANPLSYGQNNLLGKLVYHLNEQNQLRLIAEYFNYYGNSNLISATYPQTRGIIRATAMHTKDRENRGRMSLDYQFTGKPRIDIFKNIQSSLYFQQTEARQYSIQNQNFSPNTVGPFPGPDAIHRNEFYRTSIFGGNFQATNLAHAYGLAHEWTYGGEASYSRQRRYLTGYTIDKTTEATIPTDGYQVYPLAEIPPTNTLRLGVFLQDQITPEKISWLMLTPAIRFDYYRLIASNSDEYLQASRGIPAVSYHRFSVTPSFSTLIQATKELNFYANFSEGFRNPNTEDLNATFTNLISGYKVIPNPSLKPEQSYDFEIGTRGNYRCINFSVSGFYHYYNNFIDGQVLTKKKDPDGMLIFQSQNIARAEIYGVEGKIEFPLGYYVPFLEGFKIISACAYTVGNNLETHQPILTIDPFKIVNTICYQSTNGRWDIGLVGTWVSSQTHIPAGRVPFVPPSYYTIDLVGRYRLSKNALFTIGIYNLTNQTYWLYQNMASPEITTASSGGIARFSEPGISVRASFSISF